MRSFNSGRFGGDDPWFRVGNVDVSTTIAIVGLGLISMFVWAVEGPTRAISKYFWLASKDAGEAFAGGSVLGGQVWRLVTWPIANEPDFWTLILFAVFFMLGSQLEALMGRRTFLNFVLILTIVPAVLLTVFELLTGIEGGVVGLRFLELGVLVAFGAHYPTARFWPGIPAWGIAVGIVALDFLQHLGRRDTYSIVMLILIVVTSLVALRSMGFAQEVQWIPKVPLPAGLGGENQPARRSPAPKKKRRGAHLSAVAPTASKNPAQEAIDEREIDALLDQVATGGLDSLTKQQRKRLEEHSRRLRKKNE